MNAKPIRMDPTPRPTVYARPYRLMPPEPTCPKT